MFTFLFVLWVATLIGYHQLREKVWITYDNQFLIHYRLVKFVNIAITIILFYLELFYY